MLSTILNFHCVMGSVFINIIKFIIEINTVIKLAFLEALAVWKRYLEALAPLVFGSASAASIFGH